MKKLLFAVSALAALSLLAPSAGFAQHELSSNNQVGLFLTPDGTGGTGSSNIGVPVSVYLVLINPTDGTETPYANMNAFECMLNFTGPNLFKLADTLPPTSVNVGDNSDINQGFLEYIVGLGVSMDVTAGSATLISFQFMTVSVDPTYISLTPANAASVPGQMVFQSTVGDLRQMYNAAGTAGAVVFTFNDTGVIPVEDASFGSVKALYR